MEPEGVWVYALYFPKERRFGKTAGGICDVHAFSGGIDVI